jgi:hypothetical protein
MNQAGESDFTDLINYNCVGVADAKIGRLIKSRHVSCVGTKNIDVSHAATNQPTVVMHRDGDTVTAIEFVCSCGASTLVSLEYDPA